ncbi:hypothetical protein CASFOL_034981 [Castilleja foliolosa]|uniref:S-protein homolog n=1 Tax=Castilleja foliolosa TaxID=1961234 RepID=A0ABD3BS25_9LAMI
MLGSKKSMNTNISIKVVFLLLLNASLHELSLGHITTVRVYNNLGYGISLTLHCKSKDDDLGIQVLDNEDSFEWRFHPNWLGTTLFFCSMESNDKNGAFDIYKDERDGERCRECVWKVTQDGVRGYNKEGGVEQIWFRWVPKPPGSDSYYIIP